MCNKDRGADQKQVAVKKGGNDDQKPVWWQPSRHDRVAAVIR